ncbi:MAG: histidine phosphatase family protein [Candidatus Rokuibacteriota bacterium]|nr:MAG: histidine phosphatase family protein [Candidatus Rokubacteria bacterium]PYN24576.1 MAG: histidine phosphatase family protein [Candidatus Rokubacteria bacterium]
MAEVLDLRAVAGRIGDHIVLDRHRQVDDGSGHAGSLCDSGAVVRLYLVRHGKAAASFSEAPNPGLDATGTTQAEAMAERLAPLGPLPIVTSPLKRTRDTAAPLEKRWRFTARIEPAVGEIPSPMEDPAARGEWLRGVMASVWSAQPEDLKLWRQDVAGALLALQRPTVVVTHFVAINVAVGIAEGDDRVVSFAPDNCSVTVLDVEDGALRLVRRGVERATQVL